jgi:cyclophilin family peptidyl-prolyl cis-trans isomerase
MRFWMLLLTGTALVSCGQRDQLLDESDAAPEIIQVETPASMSARGPGQVVAEATAEEWVTPDPERTLYIDIADGRIVVLMNADLAPNHVAQVQTLTREGYYDGLHFYRVIEGFVAQGGDAKGEKPKGSAKDSLKAEFTDPWRDDLSFTPLGNPDGYADIAGYLNGFPAGRDLDSGEIWLAHCTGAFAFGRDTLQDSASTEFYITLQPQRYLDRNLTVFGRVIWGMEHVQAIPRGRPGNGGVIEDEARWTEISSLRLAADLPEAERIDLEMLDTNSASFKDLILARRNRPEDFFYYRPDYLDLCQLALPVRLKEESPKEE